MYKDLKKIYDNNRLDVFVMATAHLLDIGYRNAVSITDEDINELKENGLMTKEFVQDLVRLTREIAKNVDSCTEIVQFCMVEKIFDTKYYKKK